MSLESHSLFDVTGGLEEALNLSWQSATRILYHIGDAPCHGAPEFHDLGDDYPGVHRLRDSVSCWFQFSVFNHRIIV